MQKQVAAARENKSGRANDRGRVLRLRAQARAATGAERDALMSEAADMDARLAWGDRDTVRAAVLATPLISVFRSAPVASAVTVAPATADGSGAAGDMQRADATTGTDDSGCVACHVNVVAPGFETYPSPFRTHTNLDVFVSAQSPHSAARVECRQCHDGKAQATTFEGAGHSTVEPARREAGAVRRVWADPAAENAMLPLARTEASCVSCHSGEWYLPQALALNTAYVAYDRGGCYACHAFPGYERGRKRGPDLRRVAGKLSPEWMRRWLRSPRDVKPATWMPAFWQPSDFAANGRGHVEVEAVVAYLFANADAYAPATPAPPIGDSTRGEQLVQTIGCLGCHLTESGSRPPASLRRTFGPPLQSLRGKVSYAWLYDWVSEPTRFSPSTQMPSLRLTSEEAADVATYLTTLDGKAAASDAAVTLEDTAFRTIAAKHGQAASDVTGRIGANPASLSGDALRIETGRRVIAALGCYQCHTIPGFEYQQPTQYAFQLGASVGDAALAARLHVPPSGVEHSGDTREQAAWRRAPAFTLQPDELSALAFAVSALPRGGAISSSPAERTGGRALTQERNCGGCHVIEGVGGDFLKLVAEPSLGPPLLTPEGARVRPEWLRDFLRGPKPIRPWLSVRMPTFPLRDDEVLQVEAYFRAIAAPEPRPLGAPAATTPEQGQELFDLLKCQQCHVLGSVPPDQPTANLAPDLRIAHERLRPEWILTWLRDPNAVLPGTRMPTFWPDYPKSFYPSLNRDAAAQIRAIRDHVMTLHEGK